MAGENEPAKLLLPYLQRADELQKHEPLVAYYCRLYAMEKGLKIPNSERTKTTNSLLVSLMNQLEKDKKSLKLEPENNLHLEGFALNVFAKADKQDCAGRADLNTAKIFYAASIFFEIINQFGDLEPDLEQKQKYAAWKAADIRKALKEGRKPNPGPPNGDEDLSIPSSTPSDAYDLGPSECEVTSSRQDSDSLRQFHDDVNNHDHTNIPPSQQFQDRTKRQHSSNIPPSLTSYPSDGYPSHDQSYPQEPPQHFPPPPPPPPPTSQSENLTYHPQQHLPHTYASHEAAPYSSHDQSYPQEPPQHFPPPPRTSQSENLTYHQSYQQEPQQHLPHTYASHEAALYSYPNFQSYPSFSESSLPSAPTHYPSYYQGSETSYSTLSAPPTVSHPSTAQYSSSSRNGSISDPAPTTKKYENDCNYQPAPEKIAEAHKAARFAVGALAFDDVSVAVEHLKNSLELLTNPSASL